MSAEQSVYYLRVCLIGYFVLIVAVRNHLLEVGSMSRDTWEHKIYSRAAHMNDAVLQNTHSGRPRDFRRNGDVRANGNAVTRFNAGTPGAEPNHAGPTTYHSFSSANQVLFEYPS
jgi:hypothetical protein